MIIVKYYLSAKIVSKTWSEFGVVLIHEWLCFNGKKKMVVGQSCAFYLLLLYYYYYIISKISIYRYIIVSNTDGYNRSKIDEVAAGLTKVDTVSPVKIFALSLNKYMCTLLDTDQGKWAKFVSFFKEFTKMAVFPVSPCKTVRCICPTSSLAH